MMAMPGNSVIQSACADIFAAGGDHRAPGRHLGTDAEAEERQAGFGQHRVGEDEGALHQDRRDQVAQHVPRS